MSCLEFNLPLSIGSLTGPKTLAQIVAASNHRTLLKRIVLMPGGATPATPAAKFDLGIQSDAGGGISATSDLVKVYPQAPENLQTTALKTFASEPTTTTFTHLFRLHEMSVAIWDFSHLNSGGLVIPGSGRMGLRYLTATALQVDICMQLEE